MSSALNGSFALQHFERGSAGEIHNGIMLNFYSGLLYTWLPRSGTQTLKLYRCGEPGIFCRVKSAKGREEVERT